VGERSSRPATTSAGRTTARLAAGVFNIDLDDPDMEGVPDDNRAIGLAR
jgi:hypothetical protein